MNYVEFADQMTKGMFSKMDAKDKLQYIFDTEEGMYVPFARQKDYNWIARNFMIKNRRHPLASEVMNLVKLILKG